MVGMFRNVGLVLNLLRELRGMSQAQLARRAGIGKSQLSKYETGKELPKLDSLEKLLTALAMSHTDFFFVLDRIDTSEARVTGESEREVGFPTRGLLPERVTERFVQLTTDVFELHRSILTEFTWQSAESLAMRKKPATTRRASNDDR